MEMREVLTCGSPTCCRLQVEKYDASNCVIVVRDDQKCDRIYCDNGKIVHVGDGWYAHPAKLKNTEEWPYGRGEIISCPCCNGKGMTKRIDCYASNFWGM